MATHSRILAWGTHMERGYWQATVQGVTKSPTLLSDCVAGYVPTLLNVIFRLREEKIKGKSHDMKVGP